MIQPLVQIRQTYALIGMDSTSATLSISQPPADMQINTTPGELTVHSPGPEVHIDQSAARAAYTGGTYPEMSQRIYSGVQEIWLQGIAKRVEQGDRMAEFFKPGNTIAEVYGTDWQIESLPDIRGVASFDNVDIDIQAVAPSIEYRPAEVHIQVQTHQPDIEYQPGSLDIYLRQKASLSFIPPEIDTRM
ncbi:DUF6470 family protein [Paenibacillus sp. NFR01]|uniref:DUF6470 family protein n=1 Tax=Paenibacillus sp. NFR01 TaxID=1566279 RepID=UPI0008CBC6A9|nr:DUF6470 family protein [Paenibacillus sp. NFR01]SEU14156.1 hypothetical protein SAMN03159358_3575 [Paenibacillus sp. NFR01]